MEAACLKLIFTTILHESHAFLFTFYDAILIFNFSVYKSSKKCYFYNPNSRLTASFPEQPG